MKEYAPIIGMCLLAVHEQGESGIKTICSCKIPSDIMLSEYRRLKLNIEDLPVDEKKEMWNVAYEMFPYKTKEERINVCKIIHTIGTLI